MMMCYFFVLSCLEKTFESFGTFEAFNPGEYEFEADNEWLPMILGKKPKTNI
jgi:hypothetical protein